VQPLSGIEEVNMFKEDGNVLHFQAPKGEEDGALLRGAAVAAMADRLCCLQSTRPARQTRTASWAQGRTRS
jgi:hypothetical protein